ncbi:MAG TPA: hypothetical protein VII66_01065 [Gemmatimonadaceae bacterium]
MSDVLVQFDEPQLTADGRMFTAQVHGSRLPTGLWEAWIEFHPRLGGDPIRTPRQTEQLSRGDLRFWAAGITPAYLEAALARALAPVETPSENGLPRLIAADYPLGEQTVMETNLLRSDVPILDPVTVYERSGEYTLRQELRALDASQLSDIIAAYGIEEMDVVDLARTYEDALAERIVAGVQHNVDVNPTHLSQPDIRVTK